MLATLGKYTIGLGIALCVAGTFLWLGRIDTFQEPDLARMVALHLPNAAVVIIAAVVSTWHAVRYLKNRDLLDDAKSKTAAALATLFCVLTTVTGAVFARVQWGAYWNWDPKQICIFILLLIYAAYFTLRAGIEDPDKRASVSASYALFAGVMTPMLGYVVPRLMPSLHPVNAGFDGPYKTIIGALSLLLPALFFWMQNVAARYERVRLLAAELDEAAAAIASEPITATTATPRPATVTAAATPSRPNA